MSEKADSEGKSKFKRYVGIAAVLALVAWMLMRSGPDMHENVPAERFWVGGPGADGKKRTTSEWDANWQSHFGGVDDPKRRQNNGWWPAGFRPKENTFYGALPYTEYRNDWSVKKTLQKAPWFDAKRPSNRNFSALKNRWIKVQVDARSVYVQWEDVGPHGTDDVDYVFGDKPPKSKKAGLLLSPAAWSYLGLKSGDRVSWGFVEADDVPAGPWSRIVTKSQMSR